MEKVFGAQNAPKGETFLSRPQHGDILTGDNLNKNEITLVIDVACAEAMEKLYIICCIVTLLMNCGLVPFLHLGLIW